MEEVKPNKAKESLKEHYDLAKLSKELATICIDSPIEYDWEGAKIHNLYTPEAYEFFKELELKISFPVLTDTGEENKIEESFRYITDLQKQRRFLKELRRTCCRY